LWAANSKVRPCQTPRRGRRNSLATLAQSVQTEVSQVVQGKLPKEIGDKLKRIEKLAKHLRAELVR
jgi:hypothetical protein